MGLVDDALAGNVRSLSRLATHIENDGELAEMALDRLYPLTGKAHRIGLTGPPGAGKSSLANCMISAWRRAGKRVAVIAVDPSSPLSGGATLGDRIRMLGHQADAGVFIRSSASRGRTGGLAASTAGLIHLFDAVGYDIVLVETVGIGQEEIEVVHYVDSVVLVQVPGLGDGVQTLKAGVLEIADLYAVNKSDLPGAQTAAREIRALLTLAPPGSGWAPPVVSVSAKEDSGIEPLIAGIERHHAWLQLGGALEKKRTNAAEREVAMRIQKQLDSRLTAALHSGRFHDIVCNVAERTRSPRSAADEILQRWSPTRS